MAITFPSEVTSSNCCHGRARNSELRRSSLVPDPKAFGFEAQTMAVFDSNTDLLLAL
jgi:hypothetical protein